MSYGILYISNASPEYIGWALIPGETFLQLKEIKSINPDVKWICNQIPLSLRETHTLYKDSAFFGTTIDAIAEELGIFISPPTDKALSLLDIVFQRTFQLSLKYYNKPSAYDAIDTSVTLKDVQSRPVQLALNHIQQSRWVPHYEHDLDAIPRQSAFYPTSYILQLLDSALPEGRWQKSRASFPKRYSEPGTQCSTFLFLQALCDEAPAIVRLSFKNPVKTSYASVLNPLSLHHAREWFPVHEALFYAYHGQVAIRELWTAERYTTLASHPEWSIPNEGVVSLMSVSYRLFLKSHLQALLRRHTLEGAEMASSTPVGAWLSSWDRTMCLAASMSLIDCGATVTRFGRGEIDITIPTHTPIDIQPALDKCNLFIKKADEYASH